MRGTIDGLLADALLAEEPELAVDLVDGVLAVAEEVEPRDARREELPRELRADGPARARDEDALAPEVGEALLEADRDGAAPEEVLALDLARLDEVGVALDDLGDARDYPDADEAGPLEQEVELAEEFLGGARDGDDRLVGGGSPEEVDDVAYGAEDGDALDLVAYLGCVVVEEGHDLAEDGLVLDLAGYGPAGEARADDVYPAALTLRCSSLAVTASTLDPLDDLEAEVDGEGRAVEVEEDLRPALAAVDLDDLAFQALERPLEDDDAVVLVEGHLRCIGVFPEGYEVP